MVRCEQPKKNQSLNTRDLEGFRHKTLTSFRIHSSLISGKHLGEDGLYVRKTQNMGWVREETAEQNLKRCVYSVRDKTGLWENRMHLRVISGKSWSTMKSSDFNSTIFPGYTSESRARVWELGLSETAVQPWAASARVTWKLFKCKFSGVIWHPLNEKVYGWGWWSFLRKLPREP